MKKILLIAATILCFGIGSAHAVVVPTVDGLIGDGLGNPLDEWAGSIIIGSDPNEGTISDSWDIEKVYMKIVTGEASGNGFYFRMDTHGLPTWSAGPGSSPGEEAYFQFWLDVDGDLTADYLVDLNDKLDPYAKIVGLYDVSTGKIADDTDGTTNALDDIIEMYIPESALPAAWTSIYWPDFGLYASLDGRGSEPDDRLPNTGWQHPVPEPASVAMIGLGLLGIGGAIRRKRFTA